MNAEKQNLILSLIFFENRIVNLKYFPQICLTDPRTWVSREKTSSGVDLKDFFVVNAIRVLRGTGRKRFNNCVVRKRSS